MVEPMADELSYTPEPRDQILAGFRGDVPSLRTAWTYRLALVAVARAMVLLPVVYIALIGLCAWAFLAYARFFIGFILLQHTGPVAILIATLPLFIGAVMLAFLIKPLFARPAQPDRPVRLDPREEPLLFAFVTRLCEALHARVPREIHIDCQVNASASFRRGLLSRQEQWKEGRLANNLPALVVFHRKNGVRQIAPQLEQFLQREPEETFSTHPTARQRTARALREKGVGIFSSELPATALFYDWEALARQASLALYRQLLGNQVEERNLIAVEAAQERQEQDGNERGALERFFQNPNWLRGLPLPQKLPPLPADPQIVLDELAKARRAVLDTDASHAREIKSYREAVQERIAALQADALREAGFRIDAESFGLANSDPVTALQEAERAEGRMRSSAVSLEKYEKLEVRRLGLALVLLPAPPGRTSHPRGGGLAAGGAPAPRLCQVTGTPS